MIQPPTFSLEKPIVLVGLMGCGKSSIGWRLAQRIDVPFVDADREIELAEDAKISDIFSTQGEAYFREKEKKVIADILSGDPLVLATGGGAFIDPDTRSLIKEQAITIWLKADIDVLLDRVGNKTTRPLLEKGNKREILEQLMDERYPLYAEADITITTNDAPHGAIVTNLIGEIIDYLNQS